MELDEFTKAAEVVVAFAVAVADGFGVPKCFKEGVGVEDTPDKGANSVGGRTGIAGAGGSLDGGQV